MNVGSSPASRPRARGGFGTASEQVWRQSPETFHQGEFWDQRGCLVEPLVEPESWMIHPGGAHKNGLAIAYDNIVLSLLSCRCLGLFFWLFKVVRIVNIWLYGSFLKCDDWGYPHDSGNLHNKSHPFYKWCKSTWRVKAPNGRLGLDLFFGLHSPGTTPAFVSHFVTEALIGWWFVQGNSLILPAGASDPEFSGMIHFIQGGAP